MSRAITTALVAGTEVDMQWREERLRRVVLRSSRGGPCRIRHRGQVVELATRAGGTHVLDEW